MLQIFPKNLIKKFCRGPRETMGAAFPSPLAPQAAILGGTFKKKVRKRDP